MLEAQNERRRASGRAEITEENMRAEVDAAERWRAEQAERYRDTPTSRWTSPGPPATAEQWLWRAS